MATRCPFCFVDLFIAPRMTFVCTNTNCREDPDPVASAHSGSEVRRRPIIAVSPQPGEPIPTYTRCNACSTTTSTEVCPRCHYELPAQWRTTSTTCIAMAGARASGKSIYIGVLIKQLEQLVPRLGGALRFFDDQTRLVYEEHYQRPLYDERGLPQPTARQEASAETSPNLVPMIFHLGFFRGRNQMLVIRDTAGEDLENLSVDPIRFAYFLEADAVLFLFDPLNVPAVQRQLEGIVPHSGQQHGNPLLVLDNVVRIMRSGKRLSTERVRSRLALVLAKFDALHHLPDVPGSRWASALGNHGAALNRDGSLERPEYDADDGDLLQAEIESVMHRLGGETLINTVREVFPMWRLFAVSALGAPPASAQVINPRGIAPFRILDPLKWTMSHVGVMTAASTRPGAGVPQ